MTITPTHWYRYSFIVASVVLLVLLAGCDREAAQPPSPTAVPPPPPEMVEVPAGPFLMGSSDDDADARDWEKPQHELTLETYWIGKTEVTNAQFRPFVEGDGYSNPAYWTETGWEWRKRYRITQPAHWDDNEWSEGEWNSDAQPVFSISWYEAVAYTRWLSAQLGHPYRLPTEAEWEKAARGTDGRIYPWGDEFDRGRTNIANVMDTTIPVGSYPEGASPYGVLDMAGNVSEWTATKHDDGFKPYPYAVEDEWSERYLAGVDRRVVRGGAWFNGYEYARAMDRHDMRPLDQHSDYGLRLASDAPLP